MIIHNVDQNSPEWFACRAGKLTASDAKTISVGGKGLETVCYKKVAEILTGKAEEGYKSPAMDRGHELEDMAACAYEIETLNITQKVGFCELDEFTGASPDRLVGEDGLVEIKCKTDSVYVRELLGEPIDPEHYSQMQMQMKVTGRKWCDYVIFNPNFPRSIIIRRVERDEPTIARIEAGLAIGVATIKSLLEKIR